MSKYYEVKFYTKKGTGQAWVIQVAAKTTAEAKSTVKDMWQADPRLSGMHQFGIKSRLVKDTEEIRWNYFAACAEY